MRVPDKGTSSFSGRYQKARVRESERMKTVSTSFHPESLSLGREECARPGASGQGNGPPQKDQGCYNLLSVPWGWQPAKNCL